MLSAPGGGGGTPGNSFQNGQSVYPYSDQNGAKTLPDGAAHTYMVYIREYHPPGCPWDMIEWFSRDIMQFF